MAPIRALKRIIRSATGRLRTPTSCGADGACADTPEGGAFTLTVGAGLRGGAADIDQNGSVSVDELHGWAKRWLLERNYDGMLQKWV